MRYKTTINGLFCRQNKLPIVTSKGNARRQTGPLMKKTVFVSSALAVFIASSTGDAQVTVDVSKITCDQFVEYKIATLPRMPLMVNRTYFSLGGVDWTSRTWPCPG
jgi:hypothetical protein